METNNTHSEILAALNNLEAAFDNWYCNSGYLCECVDQLKQAENQEMSREVSRLNQLLAASIQARAIINKAKASHNFQG